MHSRGTSFTLTDTPYIFFASVVVVLTMGAIALGVGAFGESFRTCSVVTLLALVAFGSLAASDASNVAANLPSLGSE